MNQQLKLFHISLIMAIKTKLSLTLFLLALLCSNIAIAKKEKEPVLTTCKHQCERQYDEEEDKQICLEKCEDYIKKQEQQKHKEREKEDDEEEEENENPYVFENNDFETKIDTKDGRVLILNKFHEKSKLLQNIKDYGLAVLEIKANAFLSPHHYDSEAVLFNIKGRGIIGLVAEDRTERFYLEEGDIIRIPAGTPMYLVNRDENEKLLIAAFHLPPSSASAPVNLEPFFESPGRNPESILSTFSSKVLQAAFKTSKQKLETVLDEQNKGRIFKIAKEDMLGLAPKISLWPFRGQFKGPSNILSNNPAFSNPFGRLFEVGPSLLEKTGLEGLNLMLSFANITKGSMTTINYNTNANKIAFVVRGEGDFEMACPHVQSSSSYSKQKKSGISYHNINAKLRPGMVFVVPAGHPYVNIASKKNNLLILCFEVNAQRNKKLALAGKRNIVSALDQTAKKLAFDLPAEKVDEIFERKEEFFFPYDEERKEEPGRAFV